MGGAIILVNAKHEIQTNLASLMNCDIVLFDKPFGLSY